LCNAVQNGIFDASTLCHLQRILASGICYVAMVLSFRKSQRHPLFWLACALACLAANSGSAEVASVYGGPDGRCGSRTANGEHVNCAALTAAHRTLPFGAEVKVCHNGCVVVRINDRGPFVSGRHIDLTPAAARAIGLDDIGHVTMELEH
jgi:rare lipoprotein A